MGNQSQHVTLGGTVKIIGCCSLLVFLMLISFAPPADAFGRRPSGSEVVQGQGIPGPLNTHIQNDPNGRPPQSVPEPSSFLLVGIGLALMVLFAKKKGFYSQGTGTEN